MKSKIICLILFSLILFVFYDKIFFPDTTTNIVDKSTNEHMTSIPLNNTRVTPPIDPSIYTNANDCTNNNGVWYFTPGTCQVY